MRTTTSSTCTPGPWKTGSTPSTATMWARKSGSTTAARAGPSTPPGRFLAQADPRSEALLLADIDLADTTAQDDFLNYLRHRQTQVYHPDLLG